MKQLAGRRAAGWARGLDARAAAAQNALDMKRVHANAMTKNLPYYPRLRTGRRPSP